MSNSTPEIIITTPRLYLRRLTKGDYGALCQTLQDEKAMYAYEHAFSGEEVNHWLQNQLNRYQNDGFGLWAVCRKEDGRFIGQCGITRQTLGDAAVPEIGYLFARKYWHNGYAAEAAAACRDYAFYTLGFGRVYSIIRDNNTASINVAKRLGMEKCGQFTKHYYGIDMPHIVFSIQKPEKENRSMSKKTLESIILTHLSRWPGMEIEDCIKLVYQSVMGPGHLISSESGFKERLAEEMATPGLATAAPPAPEDIGGGLCRVHLSALYKGPDIDTLTRLCTLAANNCAGTTEQLIDNLSILPKLAKNKLLPYPENEVTQAVDAYIKSGCPAQHHSARFNSLYSPHYRLISRKAAAYLPLFAAIDAALAQKTNITVGIDGMCAAGKSTLADILADVYSALPAGCAVIHADDFFLQPHQRTKQRLDEAGGNIDYERLNQTMQLAGKGSAFGYQPFNCQTQALCKETAVPAARLTILEGAYCLHPKIGAECDIRVFLSIDAKQQMKRIEKRNTPQQALRFENEWIPMEHKYFAEFDIREGCDLVFEASTNQ